MRRILLLTIVCIFTSYAKAGPYGGGAGSPVDPYLISTPEQLNDIGLDSNDWGMCFKLTTDIDMAGLTYNTIGDISNYYYTGVFDGNEHTIRNLSGTMFGIINGATIKNLGIINVTATYGGCLASGQRYGSIDNCYSTGVVSSNATDFGGLVGTLTLGTISNSYSQGAVISGTNSQRFGGLVGYVDAGTITNCHSAASVTGGAGSLYMGGLIGRIDSGTVTDCYTTGNVAGPKYVGGLIGIITTNTPFITTVTNCRSSSPVTVTEGLSGSDSAGGLVGCLQGVTVTITGCSTTGTVNACNNSRNIGGLVGYQLWGAINNCNSSSHVTAGTNSQNLGGLVGSQTAAPINKSYSTGSVTGGNSSAYIGGLVGMQMDSSVTTNSYSTASVTGTATSRTLGGLVGYLGNEINGIIDKCFATGSVTGGYENTGGLLGFKAPNSVVTASFWDKVTTGKDTSAGGKGKTTTDMKIQSTFTSAGWDFTTVWKMNGYPFLAWQPVIGTSGNFSASIGEDEQGQITFNIYSITGQAFNWTITGYGSCGWITGVSPASGSSSGSTLTPVTVSINAAGLKKGDYAWQLTISADNGDTIYVPLTLHIFDRVNFGEFAQLASFWGTGACDWGQPCKAVDWYVDGTIDAKDLYQLAQSWLGEDIQVFNPVIADGFETGDFTHMNWHSSGDAGWTVVSSPVFEGSYSAKSGHIGDSQTSTLELTIDTTGYDVSAVAFARKISTESGYDYLRFYIDGVLKDAWSGELDWGVTPQTYTITPGLHTFTWSYSKDSDNSEGSDCVWIDSVRIYKR